MFDAADLISTYTRAQAIEDGVLVDVSSVAREAGFRIPVAMTAAAWEDFVAWSADDTKRQTYQDEAGRLWDVLWMGMMAARRNSNVAGQRLFSFYRVPRGGRGQRPRLAQAKMICGPADDASPCITIMLTTED